MVNPPGGGELRQRVGRHRHAELAGHRQGLQHVSPRRDHGLCGVDLVAEELSDALQAFAREGTFIARHDRKQFANMRTVEVDEGNRRQQPVKQKATSTSGTPT